MKFGKKGQGFSLETIIVAIIVMFVLVVLLLIFTGKLNIFSGQTGECYNNGGDCYSNCETEGRAPISAGDKSCSEAYQKSPAAVKVAVCCSLVSATGK